MTSSIDATKPVDGVPANKGDLRANLQAAKDEIEALQSGTGQADGSIALGKLVEIDPQSLLGNINGFSGNPAAFSAVDLADAGTAGGGDRALGFNSSDQLVRLRFPTGGGVGSIVRSVVTVSEGGTVTAANHAELAVSGSDLMFRVVRLRHSTTPSADFSVTVEDGLANNQRIVFLTAADQTGRVTINRASSATINSLTSVRLRAGANKVAVLGVEASNIYFMTGDIDVPLEVDNVRYPLVDVAAPATITKEEAGTGVEVGGGTSIYVTAPGTLTFAPRLEDDGTTEGLIVHNGSGGSVTLAADTGLSLTGDTTLGDGHDATISFLRRGGSETARARVSG